VALGKKQSVQADQAYNDLSNEHSLFFYKMAKKQIQKPVKQASGTAKKDSPLVADQYLPWIPVALAFVVFCTGLTNQLLAIDDNSATLDNPAVKHFSVLTQFNLGMYAPLTWTGYAMAYTLGEDNAFWYHLLSLVVHLTNVWLVFQLMMRLDKRHSLALAVSLIFAIHPIQVESVAWIAGFSTPLYATFYLLACNAYLDYIGQPADRSPYWKAIAFFILACLSKSAAVTLPVTLIVLDWWKKPAIDRNQRFLGYVPFFLISLVFGLLTIYTRHNSGMNVDPNGNHFTLLERLLILGYTPVFYWYNMLAPFNLNIYYTYARVDGQLPWIYAASVGIFVLVCWGMWRVKQHSPIVFWGFLLFFANMFVMFPYMSHGTFELCGDHYNYLSIIGIAIVLAEGWRLLREKLKGASDTLQVVAWGWGLLLVILSFMQVRTWKDTITVLTRAIDNGHNQQGMLYSARAQALVNQGKIIPALQDYKTALEINPGLIEVYKFRGALYGVTKQFDKSIADLNLYLEKFPNDAEYHYNRALSYLNLDKMQEALADLNKTIELDPNFSRAYRARGNALLEMGQAEQGQKDLQEWERRSAEETNNTGE
jgi:tetratricopeptide (TPR) repeat protein